MCQRANTKCIICFSAHLRGIRLRHSPLQYLPGIRLPRRLLISHRLAESAETSSYKACFVMAASLDQPSLHTIALGINSSLNTTTNSAANLTTIICTLSNVLMPMLQASPLAAARTCRLILGHNEIHRRNKSTKNHLNIAQRFSID